MCNKNNCIFIPESHSQLLEFHKQLFAGVTSESSTVCSNPFILFTFSFITSIVFLIFLS